MVSVGFSGGWTAARKKGLPVEEQKKEALHKIRNGLKKRTCRRMSMHWRQIQPGQTLHLYWGLRTTGCELIKEVTLREKYILCIAERKHLVVTRAGKTNTYTEEMAEVFAQEDGFESFDDMKKFIEPDVLYTVLEWD